EQRPRTRDLRSSTVVHVPRLRPRVGVPGTRAERGTEFGSGLVLLEPHVQLYWRRQGGDRTSRAWSPPVAARSPRFLVLFRVGAGAFDTRHVRRRGALEQSGVPGE